MGRYDLMLPVSEESNDRLHRFASSIAKVAGRRLGRPLALAGDIVLESAIRNRVEPTPSFRPKPRLLGGVEHVHLVLSRDYRAEGRRPIDLAAMVDASLAGYFSRYVDGFEERDGIRPFPEDHDAASVRWLLAEAFEKDVDPVEAVSTAWKETVRALLEAPRLEVDLAGRGPAVEIDVMTDPEGRALRDRLSERLGPAAVDVDTVVSSALAARRPR